MELNKRKKESKGEKGEKTETPARRNTGKPRKKSRQIKLRTEALLIKPAQGRTYSEVLSQIRQSVKPEETETEIRAVRQTRSGDVLLEFGKKSKNRADFNIKVKEVLGEMGSVKNLEPRVSLEMRDLDSCTIVVEVQEAIKKHLEMPDADVRVSLSKVNTKGLKVVVIQ